MKESASARLRRAFPRITDEEANNLIGDIDPWSTKLTDEEREKVTQLCRDVPGFFFWMMHKGNEKKPIYNSAWRYRPPRLRHDVCGGVRSVDLSEGSFGIVLLDYIRHDHKNLAGRELTIRAWYYDSGHLLILGTIKDSDLPSIKMVVSTIPAIIERHGAKLVKTDFEPAVLAALFDLQYKEYQ